MDLRRVLRSFVGLVLVACARCNVGADCSCAPKGVLITSATSDLVGASGCGHASSCKPTSPCDTLTLQPPAEGGTCSVAVLFADGGAQVVSVDFGAVHHSTDCCGDFYDNMTFVVHVQ